MSDKILVSVDERLLSDALPDDEFDQMWDLVDQLPSMFFGGCATVADLLSWIEKMETLKQKVEMTPPMDGRG